MRWLLFSFVDIWTVKLQFSSASAVYSVSDIADKKLPPSERNIPPLLFILITAFTESAPCSGEMSMSNSLDNFSIKKLPGAWVIPTVLSPCTFEWPLTGHGPEPSLPISPFRSKTFMISRMVFTEFLCWVIPMAQHTIVRFDLQK